MHAYAERKKAAGLGAPTRGTLSLSACWLLLLAGRQNAENLNVELVAALVLLGLAELLMRWGGDAPPRPICVRPPRVPSVWHVRAHEHTPRA